MRATRPNPSRNIVPPGPSVPTAPPQGAKLENSVAIREFIQALAEEVETIKKGRGGSSITVYDGIFIRRDGPFFVYTFTTESPLVVMDDAPADVEVGQQKFAGQIISIQGSEISVGIEHDFGQVISEARLITNLWYLLEALRKRYEEVLNGQRTLDWRLAQRLFGFAATTSARDEGDLDLPTSAHRLNDDQKIAIRSVLGSDVHFIWGPPGTGKTQTIGYLIASLVRRNLRVLVASHTNVATDHAIRSAAVLLEDSEDYQSGKLVRLGNISPNVGPQMPRMVVPSNIVEELGRALKARHDSLSLELAKAQSALASLQEIETVLRRKDETERLLNDLTATLQKSLSEHEQAAVRENNLSLQLRKTQEKLAQSRSAGKLKRLFFGLSPQKLQLAGANIETEIEVLRSGSAARLNKHSELKSAIDCARQDSARAAGEADSLLSRQAITADRLASRVDQVSLERDGLVTQIRAIQTELEALLSKVVREAKVIATSLTKATISKQLDDQNFDALIIDEASMAPMPSVYFAAGRASKKAIIVGDFRQLPPICKADQEAGHEMAHKWLARDIFNQAGIQQAVDQGRPEPRLTMLRYQYRMHPDISRVPNEIIYKGKLVDSISDEALGDIHHFLQASPFGQKPLMVYDVSPVNPWSSRLEQGGRYNLYSAVVSSELAKRAVEGGIGNVGIISPYAVQARLIKMMLDDGDNPELRRIKVSTVHRFQGLEQQAIIFDVAEGPMPRYGPSPLVDGSDLNSQAAKLINVSITRPKSQLVIVANITYLKSKLDRNAILLKVLSAACQHGEVLDSREAVDDFICADIERWARLLDPHDDEIDPNDSALYTERNFYGAFFADLRKASKEIIIVSPFLTASRAQQFVYLFRSKLADDVQIRIFTRTLREQEGDMFRQAELVFEEFKGRGIEVVERRGLHEKFAFVDRQIAWEGSLNILSQSEGRSTEHMRRLPFARTCQELIALHNLGSDAEVAPGARRPIETDRKCETCGRRMVLVRGPHGVFVGCMGYPQCQNHFSIRQNEAVGTDVLCAGRDGAVCGQLMVAVRGQYGVYLKCSDRNCKATRSLASYGGRH